MSSDKPCARSIYIRLADYLLFQLGCCQSEQRKHSTFDLVNLHLDLEQSRFFPKKLIMYLLTRRLPMVRNSLAAMTTENERSYCRWYASKLYSGRGAAVELGCWLGSLTISLADGLAANKAIDQAMKVIHTHDCFKWNTIMEQWVAGTPFAGRVKPGDDFMPLFLECIAPVRNYVDIRRADLNTAVWNGGEIEMLLVDAMKSMSLTSNILTAFFGSLIPGVSYVFHQDYINYYHGWIHVSMFTLRDYFDIVYEIPMSDMIVFKCKRKIPESALAFPKDAYDLPRSLVDEAYAWNFSIVREDSHDRIAAAKTMMYVHCGELEAARRHYRDYTVRYPGSIEFRRLKDFMASFKAIDYEYQGSIEFQRLKDLMTRFEITDFEA